MMDTSGFYKLDGELLYGPNYVLNNAYELRRESHGTYTYPVDGWYWFGSESEARQFFGLPDMPDDTTSAFAGVYDINPV